jgi:hypothetical protein
MIRRANRIVIGIGMRNWLTRTRIIRICVIGMGIEGSGRWVAV